MTGENVRGFLRGLFIFLLGGALGTVFGVAIGFFVFPYVFPPPEASEQLLESERTALVAAAPSSTPIRPIRSIGARAR